MSSCLCWANEKSAVSLTIPMWVAFVCFNIFFSPSFCFCLSFFFLFYLFNLCLTLKYLLNYCFIYWIFSYSINIYLLSALLDAGITTMKRQKENLERHQRNKTHTHRGARITITIDFSLETMQARREWSKIFKMLK